MQHYILPAFISQFVIDIRFDKWFNWVWNIWDCFFFRSQICFHFILSYYKNQIHAFNTFTHLICTLRTTTPFRWSFLERKLAWEVARPWIWHIVETTSTVYPHLTILEKLKQVPSKIAKGSWIQGCVLTSWMFRAESFTK